MADTGLKNSGNVAGGYKAALKNPNVSDEAKNNAQRKLDELESGEDSEYIPGTEVDSVVGDTDEKGRNMGNVIGGYKATLKNPNVGQEAKAHAKEVLEENNALPSK
ncbi:hypothetical protein HGRIS_005100 [Hohenbuehelia grisea]|uniref:Conidiation-specific protein 6 n=1 Tax=Hohenbuehelia grisea TaxID=104357 RepID=A0ABR3JFF4_9AGAR